MPQLAKAHKVLQGRGAQAKPRIKKILSRGGTFHVRPSPPAHVMTADCA